MMDSVGLRIQSLDLREQVLVLALLSVQRGKSGDFQPADVISLFHDLSLPEPSNISNQLASLTKIGLVRKGNGRGNWRVTPRGRDLATSVVAEVDLAALALEAAATGTTFGAAPHPMISAGFAPPALVDPLRKFLEDHPFEYNVFGMTRFPDVDASDAVSPALDEAREACRLHGLEFHLASDRAMDDDLWTNVSAHMWASKYGIAFFEDRAERGMNYNLTIEVGAMMMAGRRCALLKDSSIEKLPTDLVGRVRKDVDLDDPRTVQEVLHRWLRDDLGLGSCGECPD